ncbi:LOW QUALITY PROTEIN: hypothetical protein QTO34_015903 [Cnephaeus nilssonii]|uniref:DNA helicase n=1 Tax=Cnephaeus nilssonii TaxID=3371016 RepID=A0AA40I513_CNENI|nr:LOW QUALITY PROTEIN: hypothetical protein QTO34_015903 [Eptesicus nilssonii]
MQVFHTAPAALGLWAAWKGGKAAPAGTKAVLAARLNEEIIDILHGDFHTYLSDDSIDSTYDEENFTIKLLNSITPLGMPCHKLKLKDLCKEREVVLIQRIDLSLTDTGIPFKLIRRQFTMMPAFVITVNKSQGQTLDRVEIFLPEPIFGHGQLYVAFSRVRRACDVKVKVVSLPRALRPSRGSCKLRIADSSKQVAKVQSQTASDSGLYQSLSKETNTPSGQPLTTTERHLTELHKQGIHRAHLACDLPSLLADAMHKGENAGLGPLREVGLEIQIWKRSVAAMERGAARCGGGVAVREEDYRRHFLTGRCTLCPSKSFSTVKPVTFAKCRSDIVQLLPPTTLHGGAQPYFLTPIKDLQPSSCLGLRFQMNRGGPLVLERKHSSPLSIAGELAVCPLVHQAFRKPPAWWRLSKGLVPEWTDSQLPRFRSPLLMQDVGSLPQRPLLCRSTAMVQTLSSRRHWRHKLSVPPAQSATPATPSPASCASRWPNRGHSGVMHKRGKKGLGTSAKPGLNVNRSCPLVVSELLQHECRSTDRWVPDAGLMAGKCCCGGMSLSCGHSPCVPSGCSGRRSGAGMSGSGWAPSPGSASSLAACHFVHYFVLCEIEVDSGLEPNELANARCTNRALVGSLGVACRDRAPAHVPSPAASPGIPPLAWCHPLPLSLGPTGASSTSTDARCQCRIIYAHHV